MISVKCDFDDISFALFLILHEWGHWVQYIDFITRGYSDRDFFIVYELERGSLFLQRDMEVQNCKRKEEIVELNKKYSNLYANLSTEKYADEFAIEHLLEYTKMIKMWTN